MPFSPLNMETILSHQHLVLPESTVTHVELELTASAKPTVNAEPSATQQEDPAQSTVTMNKWSFPQSGLVPLPCLQNSLKNLNLHQLNEML